MSRKPTKKVLKGPFTEGRKAGEKVVKIIVEAEPTEIATLVKQLQEQRKGVSPKSVGGVHIDAFIEAFRKTQETASTQDRLRT